MLTIENAGIFLGEDLEYGERGYIEQAILWDVFGSESPAMA